MTTGSGTTIRAALFSRDGDGDGQATVAALLDGCGAVARLGAPRRLPGAACDLVTREVARAVESVTEVDPVDVVLAGWRHWAALRAAAAESLAAPGTNPVVALAEHDVTAHYDPVVEVRFDEVPLGELRFALTLTVHVSAGAVTLSGGRAVAVRLGALEVAMSLCLAGAPPETAVRRTGRIAELPTVILDPGVVIATAVSVPPPLPEQRPLPIEREQPTNLDA